MNARNLFLCIFLTGIANLSSAEAETNSETESSKPSVADQLKVPGQLAFGISVQQMDFEEIGDSDCPEMALDRTTIKIPFGKFNTLDQILVPSLSIERMGFRFKDSATEDTETYTIKTPLTFIKKHSDEWMRIVSVTPSLHSDLEVMDEEAFSLMGLALWKYSSSDVSTWTFGGGVNRLFGEYKPIPMFAYTYQPTKDLKIDIGFPRTGIENRFRHNWSTFAGVGPMGGNWRYETKDNQRFNFSYTSWVATTGIRYQFAPKLWATLEAGQTFERKLDLDAGSDQANTTVGDGHIIVFSIGLQP